MANARNALVVRNALVASVALLVLGFATVQIAQTVLPSDLAGFVCTGTALNAGVDPYRVEPMRSCEHGLLPGVLADGKVLPGTAAAYAAVPFRVLALLPFEFARDLFTLLEIAASILTIVLLRRLSGAPLFALVGVLVIPGLYVSLLTGQIAIVSTTAALLCADALMKSRFRTASCWATAAMIEPHLGLPVLATVALCVPQTRVPLIAGLGVLGAATLLSPHAGFTLEYFQAVLPAQLLSELHYNAQIGTAHLLSALGAPDGAATRVASLGYIAAMAGMAVLLKWSGARSPLIVAGPLALSIAAAPYGHISQCCAAIPALVLLGGRPEIALRTVAAFALAILAVPILAFGPNLPSPLLTASLAVVAGLCAVRIQRLPRIPAASVIVVTAAYAAYVAARIVPDPAPAADLSARMLAVAPSDLSQTVWRIFIESGLTVSGIALTLEKIGVWIALAATVGVTVAAAVATARGGVRPPAREEAHA